jgi:hypothetical protein
MAGIVGLAQNVSTDRRVYVVRRLVRGLVRDKKSRYGNVMIQNYLSNSQNGCLASGKI